MKNHSASGQSGNVLFFILIGIALFAALMFTLTRGKSPDLGAAENDALVAQEIASYADKINSAVQNIMLQNGCSETQISFENSTVAGYTNAAAAAKCKIFDTAGGGMAFATPPAKAVDSNSATAASSTLAGNYFFSGNICVDGVATGTGACAAGNAELVLVLPWVTEAICEQLDQIALNTTSIPADAGTSFDGTKFTGTFAGSYTIGLTGNPHSGCYQSSSSSPPGAGYHYYQVLIAR